MSRLFVCIRICFLCNTIKINRLKYCDISPLFKTFRKCMVIRVVLFFFNFVRTYRVHCYVHIRLVYIFCFNYDFYIQSKSVIFFFYIYLNLLFIYFMPCNYFCSLPQNFFSLFIVVFYLKVIPSFIIMNVVSFQS